MRFLPILLMTLISLSTASVHAQSSETIYRIHPQISPDGSRIAFYQREGNVSSLVVISSEGKNTQRFMTDGSYAANPSWHPSGQSLAFSNAEVGMRGEWNIWTIASDGSDAEELFNPEVRSMHTTWSPDGSNVAFVQMGDGVSWIAAGNLNSGEMKVVTPQEGRRFHPKYAASGLLAYDRTMDGPTQICLTVPGSMEETCYTSASGAPAISPTISPDGTFLVAAVRDMEHETWDLWRLDLKTEEWSQVTSTPEESETAPFIAPDGKWLAFHSEKAGEFHIYRSNLDGTERQQLSAEN